MRRRIHWLLFVALLSIAWPLGRAATEEVRAQAASGAAFSGRAIAVQATALGVTTTLADTGALPPSGGELDASLLDASIPGLLTAEALDAETIGENDRSHAEASVANLALSAGGVTVTAGLLTATATAVCATGGPSLDGQSLILGLTLNGLPVTVSGSPNQTIPLPNGRIVINEQTQSTDGATGAITVNALHVVIDGVTDVVISSAHADVVCEGVTCLRSYSGRATVVQSEALGATVTSADTGPLPPEGGTLHVTEASVEIPGLLSGQSLEAKTSGQGDGSESEASVQNLNVTVGGNTVSATVLKARARASCESGGPSISGSAQVLNLAVNGIAVDVTGQPNQEVPLPAGLGRVIVNERSSSVEGDAAAITVNALHIIVTGIADIVISSAHADIVCPTPTCPSLRVLKTADTPTIVAGEVARFTIVVSSHGPDPALNVTLTDPLPPGIPWTEDSPECAISSNELTCAFGDMPPGDSRTIHLSGVTDASDVGVLVNTARARADNHPEVESTATISVNPPDGGDPPPAQCLIYAVHDEGVNDSQFITIDPVTNVVTPLGPLHEDMDIEGLDIHPTTGILYATAGADNGFGQDGWVYRVDATNGALSPVGPTGFSEVIGLSFRTSDGTLWGWADDVGLVQIDTTTGHGTLVFATGEGMEAIAWSLDGSKLYGADGHSLYLFDPAKQTLTRIATNLPGTTEGLEMQPDGRLLGGTHKTDGITLFVYDVNTKQTVGTKDLTTEYDDIESMAYPESCPPPPMSPPAPPRSR